MVSRRTSTPAPSTAELVARAQQAIQEQGFIKLSELGTPKSRASAVAELVRQGFEATRSALRRPLMEQLQMVLEQGTFIPLRSAATFVAGASSAEVKKAAVKLVRDGHARVVLRTKAETLVPVGADVLSPQELHAMREGLESLRKQVQVVTKGSVRGSLLRSDCRAALAALLPQQQAAPEVPPSAQTAVQTPHEASSAAQQTPGEDLAQPVPPAWTDEIARRLLGAIEAVREDRMGLAFVPRVVRALQPDWDVGTVHALLLEACRRGVLELRPESGLGRLSEQELRDCPPGPQGTRLSWARRL